MRRFAEIKFFELHLEYFRTFHFNHRTIATIGFAKFVLTKPQAKINCSYYAENKISSLKE